MDNVSTKRHKPSIWRAILKIAFWCVLAVVLFVIGALVATVRVLSPERLTPVAETLANKMLNADVTVGRVELSAHGSLPFLYLDVDSLVIASRDIRSLPAEARDTLPAWADTLASVGRLHAGVNIFKMLTGVIELRDLEICRPQVNVLVVNEKINNFTVIKPSAEPDTTVTKVPDIRLNRFALVSPREIRFTDLAQGTTVIAYITAANLIHNDGDTSPQDFCPMYNVDFRSIVGSSILELIGQRTIPVTLDGIIEWCHDQPYSIGLSDFNFGISKISGTLNMTVDFLDELTIKTFDIDMASTPVSELLSIVSPEKAKEYLIPADLNTDARIKLNGALRKPYIAGSAYMPQADFAVEIPECYVKWRDLDLRKLALNMGVSLRGRTIDDTKLDITRLIAAGPATTIEINGKLTNLMSDPLFDGNVDGEIVLDRLPSQITDHIKGALKGTLIAHTSIKGRPSMLSRDHFHKLQLKGEIDADNLYYLADDTLSLYSVHKAVAIFGTNESMKNKLGQSVDSLLTGKITVDSSYILVSGLDIHLKDVSLGVGAQNKVFGADTTTITPMGGCLTVGGFSLFSMNDTAGVRINGVDGKITMRRYKDNRHLPLFNLDLAIGNISAGNNRTRFMVTNSTLNVNANKLPDDELPARRKEVRRLTDSLHHVHPDIPIDSVYQLAYEIRQRNRHHGHRVHTEMAPDDNERLYWGTSSAFAQLLLDWRLDGSLRATTGRLFTPSFPIRNRVENLNITFNNDSLNLTNVAYKAGRSDFLISGKVSNLKRGFTSRRYRSPIKINFDIISQFVDVNEIANAFFTGAANKDERLNTSDLDLDDTDVEIQTDSVGPLLIPTNINAELRMRAANLEYSDIHLHDFSGTLLLYDGAINLHNLYAASSMGSLSLSGLYSAPNPRDMDFGFGLKLNRFNIGQFLHLVPAVDSMMPMITDLSGIIDAEIAATSKINQHMDFVMPTLKAAINIEGDSIVIVDKDTYKSIAKWLLFKDKNSNVIDHISVKMLVENDMLHVYPFIFDFDRYRLGIQGSNDINMDLNYHVAVLKSPIPFKFGINIKGSPEHLKIRLGRARFNEEKAQERSIAVDTTRLNLVREFEGVFRRGVRQSQFATLDISKRPLAQDIDLDTDTLTSADSLYLRKEGLIPQE